MKPPRTRRAARLKAAPNSRNGHGVEVAATISPPPACVNAGPCFVEGCDRQGVAAFRGIDRIEWFCAEHMFEAATRWFFRECFRDNSVNRDGTEGAPCH